MPQLWNVPDVSTSYFYKPCFPKLGMSLRSPPLIFINPVCPNLGMSLTCPPLIFINPVCPTFECPWCAHLLISKSCLPNLGYVPGMPTSYFYKPCLPQPWNVPEWTQNRSPPLTALLSLTYQPHFTWCSGQILPCYSCYEIPLQPTAENLLQRQKISPKSRKTYLTAETFFQRQNTSCRGGKAPPPQQKASPGVKTLFPEPEDQLFTVTKVSVFSML